jgi:hypothetical protein
MFVMYCSTFYVLIFVLVLIQVHEWETVNFYMYSGIHQLEEVNLCVLNWITGVDVWGVCVCVCVCVNAASSIHNWEL